MSVWDYVNGINDKTYNFSEEEYNQYVINMAFMRFQDTILLVNELNLMGNISNKEHYDFLFYTISKRNRRGAWPKSKKHPNLKEIAHYYNVSLKEATDMLELMNEDEIKQLEKIFYKGGKK